MAAEPESVYEGESCELSGAGDAAEKLQLLLRLAGKDDSAGVEEDGDASGEVDPESISQTPTLADFASYFLTTVQQKEDLQATCQLLREEITRLRHEHTAQVHHLEEMSSAEIDEHRSTAEHAEKNAKLVKSSHQHALDSLQEKDRLLHELTEHSTKMKSEYNRLFSQLREEQLRFKQEREYLTSELQEKENLIDQLSRQDSLIHRHSNSLRKYDFERMQKESQENREELAELRKTLAELQQALDDQQELRKLSMSRTGPSRKTSSAELVRKPSLLSKYMDEPILGPPPGANMMLVTASTGDTEDEVVFPASLQVDLERSSSLRSGKSSLPAVLVEADEREDVDETDSQMSGSGKEEGAPDGRGIASVQHIPPITECLEGNGMPNAIELPGSSTVQAKSQRLFNVVLLGCSGVGKTTFALRVSKQSLDPLPGATVGVDFLNKVLHVDGNDVMLKLWDTAGQERFHSLISSIIRRADGAIFMYDVTSEETFAAIQPLANQAEELWREKLPAVVVGNKKDLILEGDDCAVPLSKALSVLPQELASNTLETSSYSGDKTEEVCQLLARLLIESEDKRRNALPSDCSITVTEDKRKRKKEGCC